MLLLQRPPYTDLYATPPPSVDSTGIWLQYTTTATSSGSIFPWRQLPDHTEGAQTVENQTILVGGVYHRRYTPPPDTTTTNLPVKGLAIDV